MIVKAFSSEVGTGSREENASKNRGSGQQPRSAQRHQEKRAGHQAPKTRKHGRDHHEFKAATLDLCAAQRVAHE